MVGGGSGVVGGVVGVGVVGVGVVGWWWCEVVPTFCPHSI